MGLWPSHIMWTPKKLPGHPAGPPAMSLMMRYTDGRWIEPDPLTMRSVMYLQGNGIAARTVSNPQAYLFWRNADQGWVNDASWQSIVAVPTGIDF